MVYHTARLYGLDGLVEHAMHSMDSEGIIHISDLGCCERSMSQTPGGRNLIPRLLQAENQDRSRGG
jgi:hypothetical protein